MSSPPQGNCHWRPLWWAVLIVLSLASLTAVAGSRHSGGGHGGGGHGGGGHGGGHGGNHAAQGIGHGGGHFAGHHGVHHGGGDVFLGFGYWPWYYPPYYYPPTIAVPSSPPVYVERGDAEAAPQSAYWYYCADPQGYYPYVRQCPGGWQRVRPAPPAP